jgi:hemerythrin-like domain-containing protein
VATIDNNANQILDLLHQDHQNISRLLDIFDKQIEIMHKGEDPNYRLMQDIMHYMGHYPDAFHHPREEKIFEKIKNNSADIFDTVKRLADEHIIMAEQGIIITDKLTEILNGSIVSMAAIYELTKEYLELTRNHINSEENQLFPQAEELLSTEDWQDISESISHVDDPLFGKTVEDFYRYLYSCIQQESNHV